MHGGTEEAQNPVTLVQPSICSICWLTSALLRERSKPADKYSDNMRSPADVLPISLSELPMQRILSLRI